MLTGNQARHRCATLPRKSELSETCLSHASHEPESIGHWLTPDVSATSLLMELKAEKSPKNREEGLL